VQIGVIYCNQGQRDPLKMFKNKPSEEFDRFLDDMGVDKEKLKKQEYLHLVGSF